MTDLDRLSYLLSQYDRLVEMHALVQMDTDKDRDLHRRAVDMFRSAAEPIREHLNKHADRITRSYDVLR